MKKPFALVLLALALTPLLVTGGCAADEASQSADITQSVSFEPFDVTRAEPERGLTVLKNGADYHAFFGEHAPRVNFNKYWVVHYSMGRQSHGGFATRISAILKTGSGGERTLVVHTVDESPGIDCSSTAAITYPQVTVKIHKQPGTPGEDAIAEASVVNCTELDCGQLEDRASDACFPDDDSEANWEACFKDAFGPLGDLRQRAKDCCDDGGPFLWCNDYNNGGYTCATSGGSCTDEHVGCYAGEEENEALSCPQVDSHSIQYCCVPEG